MSDPRTVPGAVAWHRWHARWSTYAPAPDHPVAYPLRVAGRMRATCRCHWMTPITPPTVRTKEVA